MSKLTPVMGLIVTAAVSVSWLAEAWVSTTRPAITAVMVLYLAFMSDLLLIIQVRCCFRSASRWIPSGSDGYVVAIPTRTQAPPGTRHEARWDTYLQPVALGPGWPKKTAFMSPRSAKFTLPLPSKSASASVLKNTALN